MTEYTLIRSQRRSFSLEIRDARLIVRAPVQASDADVQLFLDRHQRWIATHLAKAQAAEAVEPLTPQELQELARQAAVVIPARVRYYAPLIGVTYGRITIRAQRTRWGSCSEKGNLNFNCLLMLTPPEVLDSVVVHELCHRRHMNHSRRFYDEILRVFPEYDTWHRWLKDHETVLLKKLPRDPGR